MSIQYFVCPQFACQNPKILKISFSHQRSMGTSRSLWSNPFEHQSTQSAISNQNDQNAPGQPRVDCKSKLVKIIPKAFSMFLHQTWGYRIFSSTLTYVWLPAAIENLILIRPLKWVGTNAIIKNIESHLQRLLMGWNWS